MTIESTSPGKGKITWDKDDFFAGILPDATVGGGAGAVGRFNESGASAMSNIDVFSPLGLGVCSVGRLPTTVGSVTTTALIDGVIDPQGDYAYLLGAQVHRFDVTSDILTNNATWPHAIVGTFGGLTGGGTLGQVALYGSAESVIFYSYNTGIYGGDVGAYFVTQNSFDDNFMTTVPTSALELAANRMHPLLTTSDDRLLIGDYSFGTTVGVSKLGNGGKIHSYKWTTNTLERNVLNLPFGYEPIGMVEEELGFDTVVFATTARGRNRRGQSKAFWWSIDRPASWYKASPIPDDECAAPFAAFGTVGCFTRSRTSSQATSDLISVLRLYENGQWVPKFHWVGNLPTVGGVDIQDNTVVWNSDGNRFRWGPRYGKYPEAVFQDASGSGSTSGMVKSLSNVTTTTKLYMSSGTGNSGLESFSQFEANGLWQSTNAAPRFPEGKQGKVTSVQIYLTGSGSAGRNLRIDLVNNAFTLNEVVSGLTTASFTSTDSLRIYKPESFVTPLYLFGSIGISLTWSTGSGASTSPGVERVELFYETVDVTNS